MKKIGILLAIALLLSGCYGDPSASSGGDADRYATQVVSYRPAPGQNISSHGNSTAALGAPDGSAVTLGGFGGSITLRLATPIADIPGRPDFVVWGNAFYISGDSRSRWAEPGLIEVSPDNSNWYLIGGSLFNTTNRPANNILTVTSSNTNSAVWPEWLTNRSKYSFTNFCLNSAFLPGIDPATGNFTNHPSAPSESLYGYADCTPKGAVAPDWSADDPLSFGIEESGGDPIMLEWAVDTNGNSAYSTVAALSIRYIRISTAVHKMDSLLGETSTEIDAVGICR